jgi:putative NADPH-quinone reductase
MKASVILAHPYKQSFNHALFKTVCTRLDELGIPYFAHDLYAEGFNPLLTVDELGMDCSEDELVNQYTVEILDADFLFFIHPNWWGQPPAILKGYIDRVIRPPLCYDFAPGDTGGGLPVGKLTGKYGIVFNTSNTSEQREQAVFGDPLERIWKDCIFGFCGIKKYYRRMFRIVADSDLKQRQTWLQEVGELVDQVCRDR